jgi:FKBP-type peptidyl-prolyl cis-trans isomerase 2
MGRRSSAVDSAGRLKVRKNRRVTMHYRVKLSSGEEFDSSEPQSPLEIVCGRGETIQGLEKRILGMCPGEHKEFVIPPEEAFGVHDKELLRKLHLTDLPMNVNTQVGGRLSFRDKGTQLMGRIINVNKEHVVADFNHPLAGQSLHYEIHILHVAEAIPDLLSA